MINLGAVSAVLSKIGDAAVAFSTIFGSLPEIAGRIGSLQAPVASFRRDGEYVLNKSGEAPIYPFFSDVLGQGNRPVRFTKCCATQLDIKNPTGKDITLTNFKFVAEDIVPDLKAELIILKSAAPEESASKGDLFIEIINSGWLEATSLVCTLTCEDRDFAGCFGSNSLVRRLPSPIDIGGGELVDIIRKQDVLNPPREAFRFDLNCSVVSDNGCGRGDASAHFSIKVDPDGGVHWADGVVRPCEPMVYGIFIDTSRTSDVIERSISVDVEKNGSVSVPICFFPDRSCIIKFHIELNYEGRSRPIRTETKEAYFHIDSRLNSMRAYDASRLTARQLSEKAANGETVSFPYADLETHG